MRIFVPAFLFFLCARFCLGAEQMMALRSRAAVAGLDEISGEENELVENTNEFDEADVLEDDLVFDAQEQEARELGRGKYFYARQHRKKKKHHYYPGKPALSMLSEAIQTE